MRSLSVVYLAVRGMPNLLALGERFLRVSEVQEPRKVAGILRLRKRTSRHNTHKGLRGRGSDKRPHLHHGI